MTADDLAPVIEQHIPALRRYAYALTRDHDAADDLVQDCLARALSHRQRRRSAGDPRAWLFAILRNLYIDMLRRRRRRGTDLAIDDAAVPGVPPDQESGLEARDVLAALAQLPEEQRSILLLVGVEDLSYAEVAQVLGIPVGTVMSRLSRARQRLRAAMEQKSQTLLRRVK